MSKYADHIERIEAFLLGKMDESEAARFQAELQADASLQKEFAFQETLIQGIRTARRLELKNRLQHVQVEEPVLNPSYYKLLAGAAGAVVVAGAILSYFYFFQENQPSPATLPAQDAHVTEEVLEKKSPSTPAPDTMLLVSPAQPETVHNIAPAATSKQRSMQTGKHHAKRITPARPEPSLEVNMPQATEAETETPEVSLTELEMPVSNTSTAIRNEGNMPSQVKIEKHRKYKLHYSYYKNHLYLYGDFDKEPYQLIDLKVTSHKGLYMFYQQKFYHLADSTKEISPLKEVKDPDLIYKLEQLKNQ